MQVNISDFSGNRKTYGFRMPEKLHKKIKALASLNGCTKDDYFLSIIKKSFGIE